MSIATVPPKGWYRPPMTRAEFDAACARLEDLYPMSCTSGTRTALRNAMVGAKGDSHVRGLGRDYVFDEPLTVAEIGLLYVVCKALGLKADARDHGTGPHLHVQAP